MTGLRLAFQGASSYFSAEMVARAHIVVQGLVQGVGFRWFAARHAERLGLRGFALNLGNGAVEIEAEGERALIEELIALLRVGPRTARVTALSLAWREPAPSGSPDPSPMFDIR